MNKTDLSTPAQKWRLAVLVLILLTFISTLLPGTYVYCVYHPVFHPDNTNHYNYNYTYNPMNIVTIRVMIDMLISAVLSYRSLQTKKNHLLLWTVLFCGMALFWIYRSDIIQGTLWCMYYGHGLKWLPFVPPILLVLSMIAAVIAWFVGRKKA